MLLLTVAVGGLHLREYVRLLAVPVSLLMISGLAVLFEVTTQSAGVLSIPVFGVWLCVSAETQAYTALVMARALGALSCLYLLSLTTPMSDIIGVLRRARCPGVLISLMYLIYRYIFILLSMFHSMRNAAASRLGFADYRASMRTTGSLYTNLLARSYRQANNNFDAMESRCYDSEIRFLENKAKISGMHAAAAFGITVFTLSLFLLSLFLF
jgi:cobalt/nickel transport system permease protein